MKIKKLLIPLIPLTATVTPVVAMTACSHIKDVDYFTTDENAQTQKIEKLKLNGSFDFLITSKGEDLYNLEEVTAILGETSDKIHIVECTYTKINAKEIKATIKYWCDQSIQSETKDQEANFSIKLAGKDWQQKISGFKLIYKPA